MSVQSAAMAALSTCTVPQALDVHAACVRCLNDCKHSPRQFLTMIDGKSACKRKRLMPGVFWVPQMACRTSSLLKVSFCHKDWLMLVV